jgi:hypothetical protein
VILLFQKIGYIQEVKLKKRAMSAFGSSGSFGEEVELKVVERVWNSLVEVGYDVSRRLRVLFL